MACPTCGCDFVPARDAVLSCPKCGMIIAAPHDFDKGRLSCIGCGFVVPGMRLAWLRREMKWVFGAGLIIATVLLQACQG
jgi:ribosomal protein S27AE